MVFVFISFSLSADSGLVDDSTIGEVTGVNSSEGSAEIYSEGADDAALDDYSYSQWVQDSAGKEGIVITICHTKCVDERGEDPVGSIGRSVGSNTTKVSGGSGGSGGGTSAEKEEIKRLQRQLKELNNELSTLTHQVKQKQDDINDAIDRRNAEADNLNRAKVYEHHWRQQKSDAKFERDKNKDEQNRLIKVQKDKQSEIDGLEQQKGSSIAKGKGEESKLSKRPGDLDRQSERSKGAVADFVDDSNEGMTGLVEQSNIDNLIEENQLTTEQWIEAAQNQKDYGFSTSKGSQHYPKLNHTKSRIDNVRAKVIIEGGTHQKTKEDLLDLADVGVNMADASYANGDIESGDGFIKTATLIVDGVVDFVPGVSLVKDGITILTGVNPVTGEAVSEFERTIMIGTFFVPSIFAGSAKTLVKAAKAINKVASKPGKIVEIAKKLKGLIKKSDDNVKKARDCFAFHKPSPLTKFARLFLIDTAYAADCNEKVLGQVTQEANETLSKLSKLQGEDYYAAIKGKFKPKKPSDRFLVRNADGSVKLSPDGSRFYKKKIDFGDGEFREITIEYNKHGYPVFGEHVVEERNIEWLRGSDYYDFKAANERAGFPSKPKGYSWHHNEKMGKMQLINTKIHEAFSHTGGRKVWETITGVDYKK